MMLATIHDDTWNLLNIQNINPNSKRWDYSDNPGGGHKKIKGHAHGWRGKRRGWGESEMNWKLVVSCFRQKAMAGIASDIRNVYAPVNDWACKLHNYSIARQLRNLLIYTTWGYSFQSLAESNSRHLAKSSNQTCKHDLFCRIDRIFFGPFISDLRLTS